ncbi:hypothetical protein [Romboutsia sp. 13368]|uniref:hypothetical protein n=1 Tax=Romboutsia sp. 13368 TaxID=2708053 RepID=UPI0025F033DE|nr:hypothetical protein [Romboutsia sp. 13368]
MNKYIIIRYDNKSISPPMSKHEAIAKLKEYNKKGISSYLISKNTYQDINHINKNNTSSIK